jgi:DNA-directed RNA polymerase beta' subunit
MSDFECENESENEDNGLEEINIEEFEVCDERDENADIHIPYKVDVPTRKLNKQEIDKILSFLDKDCEKQLDYVERINRIKIDLNSQLENINIHEKNIPKLGEMIEKEYYKTIIDAGTPVGINASLAIGETNTQSTLNSVDYDEKIIILEKYVNRGFIGTIKIGEFIDEILIDESTQQLGNSDEKGDIYYINIEKSKKEYYAITIDEDGKTEWNKIEALTKHLPINKDGTHNLVKITTRSGKTITATKSKSFLTKKNNKIVETRGDEIKIGDFIPLMTQFPLFRNHDKYFTVYTPKTEKNVWFDEIIKIEQVEPSNKYVYDLTVKNVRTFALANGLFVADTFHYAGVSTFGTSCMGVSRLNEILNVSKKQKQNITRIKLKGIECQGLDDDFELLKNIKNFSRHILEKNIIKDIITNSDIQYQRHTHLCKSDKGWYSYFNDLFTDEYQQYDWSIRLLINKNFMVRCRMTLNKIVDVIRSEYEDVHCVFSPDRLGIIDIYIDTSEIEFPSVLSKKQKKVDSDLFIHIDDDSENFFYIRDVALQKIFEIQVCGIDGIEKLFFEKDKGGEWIIKAKGNNLRDVLNDPHVDFKNTISNNIWEIHNILGIEATRTFIIKEFETLISSSVDRIHPELLADSMTHNKLSAVSRHGISRTEVGPLTKSSFEQSFKNLLIASQRVENDNFKNIASSIIFGKIGSFGTGMMMDVLTEKPDLFKKINFCD